MEENTTPTTLIACLQFVQRGVAKAEPEKLELTEIDLKKFFRNAADYLRHNEEDESDEEAAGTERGPPANPDDEFNFEQYDEEDTTNQLGLESIATLANLGDLNSDIEIITDGPDSDLEDDLIKPTDNLLLVGHVENDACNIEVYIYNKEEGSFYVHHDILLPWFPLCVEWLSHDPSASEPGNLCALGGMDPVIQVWDLDIENSLEAAYQLGRKPNKKKKIKRIGHRDAVIDLSWNRHFMHILASGSADKTVLLWDIDKGTPHTKLNCFNEKVQSVNFHPLEGQTLLTGACDGKARVFDCNAHETFREWSIEGEIEVTTWDRHNPFCFAMCNSTGKVAYIDCRESQPVWTVDAHDREVTGLVLSDQIPGLMITAGFDGTLKTWDITSAGPTLVSERANKTGKTICIASCPEAPLSVAIGGDNKQHHLELVDLTDNEEVMNRFGARIPNAEAASTSEAMDT